MNNVDSIYTTMNKANIRLSHFVCMNTVPSTVYSVHYSVLMKLQIIPVINKILMTGFCPFPLP